MKGIDIAKWNPVTDYFTLKASGVEFAIPKVINASLNPDGLFDTHISGCRTAGIPCYMGYTYSYANSTKKAAKAAQAFVETGKPAGITYMWLDLEDTCMRGLGHLLVDIINIYRTMARNNGMGFGIYTYSSYYDSYIKKYIKELEGIPFWIARYPNTNDTKITDPVPDSKNLPTGITVSGWQYSSKGIIDGIKGYVDIDIWYSTIPQTNDITITADVNPFAEPASNCKVGTLGNDANWVLWYLWRFGKLIDNEGNPDSTRIDGVYGVKTAEIVKDVQSLLGLAADGIVGKVTRSVFKKLA